MRYLLQLFFVLFLPGISVSNAQSVHKIVHYSPTTDLIYSLKEKDSVIQVYNVSTGRLEKTLRGAKGNLDDFAVSKSGNMVIAFDDANIFTWNLPDTMARYIQLPKTIVTGIDFLPG